MGLLAGIAQETLDRLDAKFQKWSEHQDLTLKQPDIPISALVPVFAAIAERNWLQFAKLEIELAGIYGINNWCDTLVLRILRVLDSESRQWFSERRREQAAENDEKLKQILRKLNEEKEQRQRKPDEDEN